MNSVQISEHGLSRGPVSQRHAEYLRAKRWRQVGVVAAQLGVLLAFLGAWQLAVSWQLVDPFVTSQPSAIAGKLSDMIADGTLGRHVQITVLETLLSFAIGTVGGICIAGLFWWWEIVSDISDPYVVILNATPKIALGPVFIIWLGANTKAVIALAVSITLFVAILSVYSAFRQADPQKLMLVKVLGGTKWHQFSKVVFPSAIPDIISTMKVNIGLALTGTIVGEFLGADAGLGHLIIYGQNIFNMTLVMTSLGVLAAIATLMYLAVWLVERHFVSPGR